jgi:acyl carrier protein
LVMQSCNAKFIKELADILEIQDQEISETIFLRTGNWDSLAILSTISLIDELYNVTVPGNQLRECSTIGDIVRLVQAAQTVEE